MAAELAGWDYLALVLVPLVNAGLGFLGYYLMLNNAGSKAAPWVAVAFAAFYLLLLRLPARGAIHGSGEATSALHLTIAVVFLTIAIPLKTHGRWMTMGGWRRVRRWCGWPGGSRRRC